jgi:cysteine desulfurase
MMPYLTTEWGNPSSSPGAVILSASEGSVPVVVETAREQVAELIGAHAGDVIFTSCATESNNTAIAAALKANPGKRHIVTSRVEHSSVLNYCMALGSGGFTPPFPSGAFIPPRGGVKPPLHEPGYRVTYLPVDRDGLLKLADLEAAITDETAAVSLMWANYETGVLFPV